MPCASIVLGVMATGVMCVGLKFGVLILSAKSFGMRWCAQLFAVGLEAVIRLLTCSAVVMVLLAVVVAMWFESSVRLVRLMTCRKLVVIGLAVCGILGPVLWLWMQIRRWLVGSVAAVSEVLIRLSAELKVLLDVVSGNVIVFRRYGGALTKVRVVMTVRRGRTIGPGGVSIAEKWALLMCVDSAVGLLWMMRLGATVILCALGFVGRWQGLCVTCSVHVSDCRPLGSIASRKAL